MECSSVLSRSMGMLNDGMMGKAVVFFQAEDGIRDYKVTGVQTCALPISCARAGAAALAQVARLGGRGGLIAVDRGGRIAMPFNSEGMYRACIDRRGRCMIVTNDEHVSA